MIDFESIRFYGVFFLSRSNYSLLLIQARQSSSADYIYTATREACYGYDVLQVKSDTSMIQTLLLYFTMP